MSDKRLKAYAVHDDEHAVIVFENNSASARRNGGSELGCEWDGVTSCRRAPWADEFSVQRWVPVQVMLNNGWWRSCSHCGNMVFADGEDEEGNPTEPVIEDRHAWCNAQCKEDEAERIAERKRKHQEITERTLARWPEARIDWINEYAGGPYVHFRFDGGIGLARWKVGEPTVSIDRDDLHHYLAWNFRQQALSDQ